MHIFINDIIVALSRYEINERYITKRVRYN